MSQQEKLLTAVMKVNDVDILREDEDMAIVSLDILHIGENRNRCDISESAVETSLGTIANKPILLRYNRQDGSATDVTEHARNKKQKFDTRVVGHVPTNSRMKLVKRDNGKTYLCIEGVLQKLYCAKLMEILRNNNGELKVSTEIRAEGKQRDDGIFEVVKFKLQGIMLLSNSVLEGIEGSKMQLETLTDADVNAINERYFAFSAVRNDSFEDIINAKEAQAKVETLTNRQLEARLWDKLKDFTYHDGRWKGKRYWIQDIAPEQKVVYIHDNMTDKDYQVSYELGENGEAVLDMDGKVEVRQEPEWKEKAIANAFVFAKEEWGQGEKVEIDKSKEAMSDTPWGDIDKIDLRNKVMEAANYDELAHAVYLRVEDGWEEAPSEKLGYPVMEIKQGKAVYNRYGLAAALAYAEAQNDEEVLEKVRKLYVELEIGVEDKKNELEDEHEDEINDIIDGEKDEVKAEDDEIKKELDELKAKHEELEEKHEELEKAHDELKGLYDKALAKIEELNKAHAEMCGKLAESEGELKKFRCAEIKAEKARYAATFRNAFDDDEYEIIARKLDDDETLECFKAFVDAKITEKAKKQFAQPDAEIENRIMVNSLDGIVKRYDKAAAEGNKIQSIDDVLALLG